MTLTEIGQCFSAELEAQNIHWSAITDQIHRRKLVFRLLRAVPTLWIWDNVEPVAGFPDGIESQWTVDEQAELRDFLKQIELDTLSRVKILLTSRRDEQAWLGGIPHRIAMPRMRYSDSAKLAYSLGEEKKIPRSEVLEWQPLIDYCSGNPLTLKVLVSQVVKIGLRGKAQIGAFVETIRSGEQRIDDADEKQGRQKSLRASLDYGFRNAFSVDELPIIALLHLFQGAVNVGVLFKMSTLGSNQLPELRDANEERLSLLLERAREVGLLTYIGLGRYSIHPALPWFFGQLFARHFDGQAGRSTSQTVFKSWVQALGQVSEHLAQQSSANQDAITALEIEEFNLLQARKLARQLGLWGWDIACMQGLRPLYRFQGRYPEWARLVEEVRSDYCSDDNTPLVGREDSYGLVMEYRIELALHYERNAAKAANLQRIVIPFHRVRAADIFTLATDVPLEAKQRHRLRNLGVGLSMLGQILLDLGDPACIALYEEAILIDRRIGDRPGEAIDEFTLGHAYKDLAGSSDLAAAEAAYRRSLHLRAPSDTLGRARCIKQIGLIHQKLFVESRRRSESEERQLRHARAAEECFNYALQMFPPNAIDMLSSIHHAFGELYTDLGQFDQARKHFEQDLHYAEKAGDAFGAGQTRYSMARMSDIASKIETQSKPKRDFLQRAQAYCEASLRDFEKYPGRVRKAEAQSQRLLEEVLSALAHLRR